MASNLTKPALCHSPSPNSVYNPLAPKVITWANAKPGADTLGLDADITLSTALPQVSSEITLEGAGFSVDGASTYRVFEVTSIGNFTVNQITIQNGSTSGNGGAILNDGGTLTVTNSTVSGNTGDNGGGIYSASGTLTATNSTISGNTGKRRHHANGRKGRQPPPRRWYQQLRRHADSDPQHHLRQQWRQWQDKKQKTRSGNTAAGGAQPGGTLTMAAQPIWPG